MITNEYIISAWLSVLAKSETEGFTPLHEGDKRPERAWEEAVDCAEVFFQDQANPFNKANAPKHSFHVANEGTFDYLRHSFVCHEISFPVWDKTVKGLDLVVTETGNLTHIQLKRSGVDFLGVPDRQETTGLLCRTLTRVDAAFKPWNFSHPEVSGDALTFSTNPEAYLYTLPGWLARVDALVSRDRIVLLLYKKTAQRVGFRDDRIWFDDSFRANRRDSGVTN